MGQATTDTAMHPLAAPRALVLRYAALSLAAFAVIGLLLHARLASFVDDEHRTFAQFHALFITDAVLENVIEPGDLSQPITGARYDELRTVAEERVLGGGVIRVRVWSVDATILFSDLPRLVGRTFPAARPLIARSLESGPVSRVSDMTAERERFERSLARRAFQTFVPLEIDGAPPAVVEVDQDFAPTQAAAHRSLRQIDMLLAAGLFILWAVTLPIAYRTGTLLRRQATRLAQQAGRLAGLLGRERETVQRLHELDRMKSDFVSVASHELRTPITAIVGFAKTLLDRRVADDDALRADIVVRMDRQADRLLRLSDQLLATDRIEHRHGERRITTFPVSDVLREAIADRERVELDTVEALELSSDREALARIVGNLVDNAIKYSGPETVTSVGARPDVGGVLVWVSDRGVGMDEAALARAFEPFWQAEGHLRRRADGVGLGLHLVRLLVEELEGRIDVTSRPGQGTRFTVRLPSIEEAAPAPREARELPRPARRPS